MRTKTRKTNLSKPKLPKTKQGHQERRLPNVRPVLGGAWARKAKRAGQEESLISDVRSAALEFKTLSGDYLVATEGYRAQIYEFAARCYEIARGFSENFDQFERFMADPFWTDVRQKPKPGKIMKAVLTFAMDAKSRQLLNRACKTAAVLDSLAGQDIDPTDVAEHLKSGGGIEKMYRELSPDRSDDSRVADDLELLSPSVQGDDDVEDSCEDDDSSVDAFQDWEKSFEVDDDANVDEDQPDRDVSNSSAMSRAASDVLRITDVGGPTKPPKTPSPRTRYNPEIHLLVDLSEIGMSPEVAMRLKALYIIAAVGLPDDEGFRPVYAKSVKKAGRISGLLKKSGSYRKED